MLVQQKQSRGPLKGSDCGKDCVSEGSEDLFWVA